MPLNDIGRRYADRLLQSNTDQTLERHQAKTAPVDQDFSSRNMTRSGMYIKARANILVELSEQLGQSKVDSLLRAYERQGLPFDDAALGEIKEETIVYCHRHQDNAVGNITSLINRIFPGQPQINDAIITEITSGVSRIVTRLTRDLEIKRDEAILDEMKVRKAYAAGLGKRWDVFICHASEDKEDFARPLASALHASGLLVWYDEFTLSVGDSLRRKIDEGISNSRYGIVVLSHSFFAKNWPQHELDGLMSKEVAGSGAKVILPVWHKIGLEEVRSYSPTLSGLVAANSADGMDVVASKLRQSMGL